MNYLYHKLPEKISGTILYPLNQLKQKFPEAYEKEFGKYIGRERLTQRTIPILDCLWNDVLHFSAVHPAEVKKALIGSGRDPDFTMTCFQIDVALINPKDAVIYLYSHDDDQFHVEDYVPFDPDRIAALSIMPQATKRYYKEVRNEGKKPLLYHLVPHILYKGTIDITDLPILSV